MGGLNCPNCGAPKRGSVCEYCGTHFSRYEGQFVIEVEPETVSFYDWSGEVKRVHIGTNVTLKVVE